MSPADVPGGTEAVNPQLLMQRLVELLDDPRAKRIREQSKIPIATHIADWENHLTAKGNGARHVHDTVQRVTTLMSLTQTKLLTDLCPSVVSRGIAELRKPIDGQEHGRTRGNATLKHFVDSFDAFCRWLVIDRRVAYHPAQDLPRFNIHIERRRERRVLTLDEIQRLLSTTQAGPERRGMTGPERSWFYRLLLGTGLRLSEAVSLTPASFDLAANPPTVTVEAGYSKRRRRDVLPLRVDLAAGLRMFLAGRKLDERIWPYPVSNGAKVLRADMEAARVAWCDRGRFADLHAQRHTFITHLVRYGGDIKAAQELARHCDARLTLRVYTHTNQEQKLAALAKLPPLGSCEVTKSRTHGGTRNWSDGESNPDLLNAIQSSPSQASQPPQLSKTTNPERKDGNRRACGGPSGPGGVFSSSGTEAHHAGDRTTRNAGSLDQASGRDHSGKDLHRPHSRVKRQ